MNWRLSMAFIFTIITTLIEKWGEKTFHVKSGNIVKAIAPGSSADREDLPSVKDYMESIGLVANISENIYSNEEPIYSNSDEFRANDLVSALLDDNIKVIWAIRGGTGSIRIIPLLEKKLPATLQQKILIGYSDVTALHIYFQYKYGWQSIHVGNYFNRKGLMLDEIVRELHPPLSVSVVTTVDFIFGRQTKICLPATKLNDIHVTRIESKVVGGNSAMVEMSIGTVWEVNPRGRILFLEDIADYGEHIEKRLDRMLQCRTFDGVDAVIFGDFVEADNDDLINFVLDRFALSVSFPVFRITNMGHGTVNYPLPFLTHSVINSVDGGKSYEFCVDNIQNTINGSSKVVHLTRKFNFIALIVIGFYLLVY